MLQKPWFIFTVVLVGALGLLAMLLGPQPADLPNFSHAPIPSFDSGLAGNDLEDLTSEEATQRFSRNLHWAMTKSRGLMGQILKKNSEVAKAAAKAPAGKDLTANAKKLAEQAAKKKKEAEAKKKKAPKFEFIEVGRRGDENYSPKNPLYAGAQGHTEIISRVFAPPKPVDPQADEQSTAEYWIRLLTRNPILENQTRFIDAKNGGKLKEEQFFEVIAALFADQVQEVHDVGFAALESQPSLRSFVFAVSLMEEGGPNTPDGIRAQKVIASYTRSEALPILRQVLVRADHPLAEVLAARAIAIVAKTRLEVAELKQGDGLQVAQPISSNEYKLYSEILQILKTLAGDAKVSPEVQAAATDTIKPVESVLGTKQVSTNI